MKGSRKVLIIAFTRQGLEVGKRLERHCMEEGIEAICKVKSRYCDKKYQLQGAVSYLIRENWVQDRVIVFISACGIAVRMICGSVRDKRLDPAVLVIDEMGTYCISLLSGHLGGANEWTRQVADWVGAEAVVTTATDMEGSFAMDMYGASMGLEVADKEKARQVTAAVLARQPVITLGIGCRKNTSCQQIEQAVEKACKVSGISMECICCVASIDLKQKEPGLVEFCQKRKVPFQTYSKEELQQVKGDFSTSVFVKAQTGVGNVCERSAVLASQEGILVYRKRVIDHITVSMAVNLGKL